MKKTILKMLPYLFIFIICYYIVPFIIVDTGTAMLLLLMIMPLLSFICPFIYGVRHGFNLLLAVCAGILFIPAVFIHYNKSAMAYAAVYGMIAMIGNAVGKIFYGKK